jgi:DNA-binding SARP family transcriptional activator
MGLHTGEPRPSGERYVGLGVHRAARICAVANGGQIVLSSVTRGLVEEELPPEISLRDLGEYRLKDFDTPEHLFDVDAAGLRPNRRAPRAERHAAPNAGRATIDQTVTVSILGPLDAKRDGQEIDLGTPQQRALLALLAVRRGEVVPVDVIVDTLWSRAPPPSAGKTVQTYVSRLRKALGDEAIERRGAGYALRLTGEGLDLARFEELAAAGQLTEALALWRGPAFADLQDVEGLRIEADRLEELRLRALEERIDADLESGRHREVVAELRSLVASHPLRERFCALLMLALYRSGRQAEALDVYRTARARLVDDLGIEPSEHLRSLESAILRQAPELDPPSRVGAAVPGAAGSILVWHAGDEALEAAVELAETLAEGREVIVVELVARGGDLQEASKRVDHAREALAGRGVVARSLVFTSDDPGGDVARLAREQDVHLAVGVCPSALLEDGVVPDPLARTLAETPPDIALVSGPSGSVAGPVAVPFGAAEHDWAAVELGAWIALATGLSLQLIGAEAEVGGRDASRTLATASLVLQRHLGVSAEPVLAEPGTGGILTAVRDAGLVVAGLPEPLPHNEIGPARLALLRDAAPGVVLVRRGQRPGGLAPPGAVTRFSWSRAR